MSFLFRKKSTTSTSSSGSAATSPKEAMVRRGDFMAKPEKGWLHHDKLLAHGKGVYYSFPVRYVGSLQVLASLHSLGMEEKTAVCREAIARCMEAAKLRKKTKRNPEKYFKQYIADAPYVKVMEIKLNVSTSGIATSDLQQANVLSNDPIGKISFATGGEKEDYYCVTYVAKDKKENRYCHVFDCGILADDLLSTLGQVFTLNTSPPKKEEKETHLKGAAALAAAAKRQASEGGAAASNPMYFETGPSLPARPGQRPAPGAAGAGAPRPPPARAPAAAAGRGAGGGPIYDNRSSAFSEEQGVYGDDPTSAAAAGVRPPPPRARAAATAAAPAAAKNAGPIYDRARRESEEGVYGDDTAPMDFGRRVSVRDAKEPKQATYSEGDGGYLENPEIGPDGGYLENPEIGPDGAPTDSYLDQSELNPYDDGTGGPGGVPIARPAAPYGEDTYLDNPEVYGDADAEPATYLENPEEYDLMGVQSNEELIKIANEKFQSQHIYGEDDPDQGNIYGDGKTGWSYLNTDGVEASLADLVQKKK